jgi:hypothetical protein
MIAFESDADRASFLALGGGTRLASAWGECWAIVNAPYLGDGEIPVDNVAAQVTVLTRDAEALHLTGGVTVWIKTDDPKMEHYVIRSVQPDREGMSTLILETP